MGTNLQDDVVSSSDPWGVDDGRVEDGGGIGVDDWADTVVGSVGPSV